MSKTIRKDRVPVTHSISHCTTHVPMHRIIVAVSAGSGSSQLVMLVSSRFNRNILSFLAVEYAESTSGRLPAGLRVHGVV